MDRALGKEAVSRRAGRVRMAPGRIGRAAALLSGVPPTLRPVMAKCVLTRPNSGADGRTRTDNRLFTRQVRYQLRHASSVAICPGHGHLGRDR